MDQRVLEKAVDGRDEVGDDWVSPTDFLPLAHNNPAVVWLEGFGDEQGFYPDFDDYSFGRFVAEKGQEFQEEWVRRMVPDSPIVCEPSARGQYATAVHETAGLLRDDSAAVVSPALWWAPENLYGVPDLLIRREYLGDLVAGEADPETVATLEDGDGRPPYVVVDFKFTSELTSSRKSDDLEAYQTQVRAYSFLLCQCMPESHRYAYLVTRDRVLNPIPVPVNQQARGLLGDLAEFRDHARRIKRNGRELRPWEDDIVAINFHRDDEKWKSTKKDIRWNYLPGGDPGVLPHVGYERKRSLVEMGYGSLDALLEEPPDTVPLEECHGIGPTSAGRIRTVLSANRDGELAGAPAEIPDRRAHEIFVDFEYFTNVNVDFFDQWPELAGQEMIFVIGAGQVVDGAWNFTTFVAESETDEAEAEILDDFLGWLEDETDAEHLDSNRTALYHWSWAEVSQSRRAADRQDWEDEHPLRNLPWVDLQSAVRGGPLCLPDMWGYGLKEVSSSLSEFALEYGQEWPEGVAEGLRAMVVGWRAYEQEDPVQSTEMQEIEQYLEVDCHALERILTWLREWEFE